VDAAHATLRQFQGARPGSDPAAADRLRQQTADAQRAVGSAEAALQEIIARARQLAGRHEAALKATAARIREAADAAPPEPGFWDKLGDALSDVGDWIASIPEKVGQWVEEHKYLIKALGDLLSDISVVVGIVSLFLPPPADVIGLAISGGLSLAAMGAHAVAWAAGAEGINALGLAAEVVDAGRRGAGRTGRRRVRQLRHRRRGARRGGQRGGGAGEVDPLALPEVRFRWPPGFHPLPVGPGGSADRLLAVLFPTTPEYDEVRAAAREFWSALATMQQDSGIVAAGLCNARLDGRITGAYLSLALVPLDYESAEVAAIGMHEVLAGATEDADASAACSGTGRTWWACGCRPGQRW
jgi:hypothetical protein